jgi:hypothetical protein
MASSEWHLFKLLRVAILMISSLAICRGLWSARTGGACDQVPWLPDIIAYRTGIAPGY